MIGCGKNDSVFFERILRESNLTLFAGDATEETQKHTCEILQSQTTADLRKVNKDRKLITQEPITILHGPLEILNPFLYILFQHCISKNADMLPLFRLF